MTSERVPSDVLRNLSFGGGEPEDSTRLSRYAFERDFDSDLAWPDMPFDTASPDARYAAGDRSEVERILDDAADVVARRAPRVLAFVNEHMQRALLRRSGVLDGASSSANRHLVGRCVLTNVHMPQDRIYVCIEGLTHESIHQYLYRTELQDGPFCDLSEGRKYRSPWSGNRIPLHSLVHAALVWFGLLTMWWQLARSAADDADATVLRERASRILFGFDFVADMMNAPSFPKQSVQPEVITLIGRMTAITASVARPANGRTLSQHLATSDKDAWVGELDARLGSVTT